MHLEYLQGLQCLIVFLDYCHLLVLEVDLMSTNYVEKSDGSLAAQNFVVFLLLEDVQKPDNSVRVYHFTLKGRFVTDIEFYHLQNLEQGIVVMRVHQSVEHVNIELLVQSIFLGFLNYF